MFCKYCGNKIDDNSIFCSKCGKSVRETEIEIKTEIKIKNKNNGWLLTENLEWKKPYLARTIQIILFSFLIVFTIYNFYSLGGGAEQWTYRGSIWSDNSRPHSEISDPLGLYEIYKSSYPGYGDYLSKSVKEIYVNKIVWIGIVPSFILIILICIWIKQTPFPDEENLLIRDIADEIEPYEWYGFSMNKYIFFKRDGKYGVIDAKRYSVKYNAIYDYAIWRTKNKSFDVELDGEKQTIEIEKN